MHLISPIDADRNGAISEINRRWQAGEITREELQTLQDTALIQAGEVCENCRARAVKAILRGKKLCGVCSKVELRRRAEGQT